MAATITATKTAREYLRVSADKSGDMHSPDEQHSDNELAALGEGWKLGKPYREVAAISASKYTRKSRPAWDALVADLTSGRFGADVVILWEPSRGSRRMTTWAPFIEACEAAGVLIHVTSHGRTYDPANARDVRSLLEDGVDSQYESAKTAGRVKRGMDDHRAKGGAHGRPAYGYTRTYRTDDGTELHPHESRLRNARNTLVRQVPEPSEAPVVKLIITSRRAGESWRSIAAALNGDGPQQAMGEALAEQARELAGTGAPTREGGQWTPSRVRDIAANPVYIGMRLHKPGYDGGHVPEFGPGDLTPGRWPALVSEADFWAVKATIPGQRAKGTTGRQPKHLLSMIAECGRCSGPVSVRYTHGGDKARYSCRDKSCVTTDRDPLDAYVVGAILALMSDPDAWAMMSPPADDSALLAARDELATVKAEHDELTRLVGAGKLSAVLAASAEPAILARVDAASKRVRELEAPSGVADLGLAPGPAFAQRWDSAPLSARRALVRILFASIKVLPAGRGFAGPVEDRVEIERRHS